MKQQENSILSLKAKCSWLSLTRTQTTPPAGSTEVLPGTHTGQTPPLGYKASSLHSIACCCTLGGPGLCCHWETATNTPTGLTLGDCAPGLSPCTQGPLKGRRHAGSPVIMSQHWATTQCRGFLVCPMKGNTFKQPPFLGLRCATVSQNLICYRNPVTPTQGKSQDVVLTGLVSPHTNPRVNPVSMVGVGEERKEGEGGEILYLGRIYLVHVLPFQRYREKHKR